MVPPVTTFIVRAIMRLTNVSPICVGPDTKTNIKVNIRPELVGADLLVGCVAAAGMFHGPTIILDMGTATTLMVLNEEKTLLGGAICPGVGISLHALTHRTAQLPSISLDAPKQAIGSNTIECMRSGIILGTACMIDGMVERMETELGRKCHVVATGGLSRKLFRIVSIASIFATPFCLMDLERFMKIINKILSPVDKKAAAVTRLLFCNQLLLKFNNIILINNNLKDIILTENPIVSRDTVRF